MWTCTGCAKKVDEAFDACWNCGSSRDGVLDPDFVREMDVAGEADTGKDAIFFVRRTLKAVAHAITAPPRQSIPRWASWCCTASVVALFGLLAAGTLEYRLVVEPAFEQGRREFYARYPHADGNLETVAYLVHVLPTRLLTMATAEILLVFTAATWPLHGLGTKVVGFAAVPLAEMMAWLARLGCGL